MAPEQFLGGAADSRTDQFSFCVALWEALAGERPFPGKNVADLSAAVLDNERRPMPAEIPPHVAAVLTRGLAPEPADRYVSMDEVIAALTPPTPRRPRALAVGGAAVAAAAATAVALFALTGSSRADPCEDVGDEAAELWTPERRAAAEAAFVATGNANAAAAWQRVAGRLDDYVAEWSLARRDVCEASQVRREQSAELADKRIACLDERLGELRAVVILVEGATDSFVENAVETAAGMASIEACSNVARLAGAPDIPEELAAELAALKALERAAHFDRGIEAARAALERAEAAGSSAGRARALLYLGIHQERAGLRAEAVESTFAAIRVADDAGDTRTEAEAWIQLVHTVGARLHRFAEAERWAKHAEYAIRQDGSSLELEARLRYNRGTLRRTQGRFKEALDELRQAVHLGERAFGPGAAEVLRSKLGVASALRELERNHEAIDLQLESLAGLLELYGEGHPQLASAHHNLATSLGTVQRYDEAREHYRIALDLRTESLGGDHTGLAYMIRDVGILEEQIGNFDAARELFTRELELRRQAYGEHHPRVHQAVGRLARIARRSGDLDAALRLQLESVDGMRALGADARDQLGLATAELCEVRRRAQSLAAARRACAEAVAILEADANDPRDLAVALTRAAHVELGLGNDDSAREQSGRALAIRREHSSGPDELTETLYVAARALAAGAETRAGAAALMEELEALAGKVHPGEDDLRADIEELARKL
jgi:tetratricopeptide (TPR) repeat protein